MNFHYFEGVLKPDQTVELFSWHISFCYLVKCTDQILATKSYNALSDTYRLRIRSLGTKVTKYHVSVFSMPYRLASPLNPNLTRAVRNCSTSHHGTPSLTCYHAKPGLSDCADCWTASNQNLFTRLKSLSFETGSTTSPSSTNDRTVLSSVGASSQTTICCANISKCTITSTRQD